MNNSGIYKICNPEDCGKYIELKPCGDGGISVEQECEFVENFGCDWVVKKCYKNEIN